MRIPYSLVIATFEISSFKKTLQVALACFVLLSFCITQTRAEKEADKRYPNPINLNVPHITKDTSVKYDFPIVYVRVPRKGNDVLSKWAEISHPVSMDPGGDLMLLQPYGKEEVLDKGGASTVVYPDVTYDGQWIINTHIHDMKTNWARRFPKG
jgi:hypothetical protein